MTPTPRRPRTLPALLALGALLPPGASGADPSAEASSDGTAPAGPAPRVVELFTSHGCSSCPPADELLGRLLAADPSVVALEYHVDYWDELVHGADGSFADPFSDPAHTARQRAYAAADLDGRPGVYTPQLVVDGRRAMVGSDRARLGQALLAPPDAAPGVRVEVTRPDGDGRDDDARSGDGDRDVGGAAPLAVTIDATGLAGDADGIDVTLVRYHDRASTEVTGGENRHRTVVNHRVVHALEPLGRPVPGERLEIAVAAAASGDGCAVLVQDRSLATLHAAALCPD